MGRQSSLIPSPVTPTTYRPVILSHHRHIASAEKIETNGRTFDNPSPGGCFHLSDHARKEKPHSPYFYKIHLISTNPHSPDLHSIQPSHLSIWPTQSYIITTLQSPYNPSNNTPTGYTIPSLRSNNPHPHSQSL